MGDEKPADEQAANEKPDSEKAATVQFREGDYLSGADAAEVVRCSPTNIIVVAGVADCGKTTLVAGLYDLFHKGTFAGYHFAGSRTLPGFERRSHLARLASGKRKPDTERTKPWESDHLLHLKLAELSPPRHFDLLFSDVYGETFRRAAGSADECSKFLIFKRADHVAVLVDGAKVVSKVNRQEAFSSVDSLLQQCLDTGMLDKTSLVEAVVTKWDLVDAASAQDRAFVDSKLKWLSDRHGARLGELTQHKVAIRPTGGGPIKAGHGMERLLRLWVATRAHPRGMANQGSNGEFHSEFDRLAASWPVDSTTGEEANE